MDNLVALAILVALALVMDILTGMLSAPSIVATMVASRAMSPRKALLLSTIAELIGPFLFGLAVASAVGEEIIPASKATMPILYAALGAAILWVLFSWIVRLPSSSSHAQIGGLVGAALVAVGASSLQVPGLLKMVVGLVLAAPLTMLGGFWMVRLFYWLARNSTPRVNYRFSQGQWLASFLLGLAIGSNSSQRTMGIITLGLMLTGYLPHFEVQPWVIGVSALGLALGNLISGGRLLRVLGGKFFKVRPIHGLGAQVASAAVMLGSSALGGPVSATHLTGMAIIGAGSAERLSGVRWNFVQHVMIGWLVATPITAALGGLLYTLLKAAGLP